MTTVLGAADLADLAKRFTVQVYCETGPPKSSSTAPVPSEVSTLEREARQFAVSLQAKWSRPNEEALAGIEELYEDEVLYFGKLTTRDQVIREKQAFVRKFPEREYRPRENITVSCKERVCNVGGLVDFRSVNPVTKVVSKGIATFEYRLRQFGQSFKIFFENGEVLKRDRTPLASVSALPASSNMQRETIKDNWHAHDQ